jgi:hypothetical protein
MAEKYEKRDLSDSSLEGQETLHGTLAEATFHDTDVFGHEEDHDVRSFQRLITMPLFCYSASYKSSKFRIDLCTDCHSID